MDSPSAMRRKAGAGRPPPEIGRVTPGRALRVALTAAADKTLELLAAAGEVTEDRTTRAAVTAELGDHPLLLLLDGGDGSLGLAVLDAQFLAALVEIQTTGRVVPRPAAPRAPTRTDAVMCEDFLEALLRRFEAALVEAGLDAAALVERFTPSAMLDDGRAVEMAMDDVPYRRFRLSADLGNGAKTGMLQFIFPATRGKPRAGAARDGWHEALRDAVEEASCLLGAELFRTGMTLAQVAALAPGNRIVIPRRAVASVRIHDIEGRQVARARLGQINGNRALRLDMAGAGTGPDDDLPLHEAGIGPAPGGAGIPDLPGPGLPDAAAAPTGEALPDLPALAAAGDGDLPPLGGGAVPDLADFPMVDLPDITD